MNRTEMLTRIQARQEPWDLLVIGGGATGVGVAVDAAARGYAVVLLEQHDFGKGTSSRSTKLVHGGVRYLQQGNVALVMDALKERGLMRKNAPHLVHDLRFIVPNYAWWEAPFYGVGMKVYDMLAGRYGFGPSRHLSKDAVLEAIPTLEVDGLRGGVQYFDGQFDDARLLINLVQTAAEQGATLANYLRVTALSKDSSGFVNGCRARDLESGVDLDLSARCVINATGPFVDTVRKLDEPDCEAMIAPSQGVHLVFDRSFLPGDTAIMVPRTSDGRVLFAIPWHDHALVGTTDTAIEESQLEPLALEEEVEFILETAGQYLERAPQRSDVKSVFTGIRPLVKAGSASTASLSRDHTIHIANSALLTVTGGKWTTYRHMAEDVVDHAATLAQLDEVACVTRRLHVHGYHENAEVFGELMAYGSDAPRLKDLMDSDPEMGRRLHPDSSICKAQVLWAVRFEMARSVEDVLARRTRILFLDARVALSLAPAVASLVAAELGFDQAWCEAEIQAFEALAAAYILD